jgi:voltage-dependent potassium channel beta subunit
MKVSELALGGWTTFGDSLTDKALARQIIITAYESGINFFDIADVYARGESELLMGETLRAFPRHTLVISSKVFWPMSDDINDRGLSRKHIMESIEGSLKRIGTDYLDIYFCHRYDEETPLEETVRAMDDLIHQGKILYWGTSEWTADQIQEALNICEKGGYYPPQSEQPQYSMLKRDIVEDDILPVTEPNGMGLVVFSPLATGLLTGKYDDGIEDDSRFARLDFLRERWHQQRFLEAVRELKPIADDMGVTRAQMAIAWTLRNSGVASAITGATRVEQLHDTLKATDITFDDSALDRIDAVLGTLEPA